MDTPVVASWGSQVDKHLDILDAMVRAWKARSRKDDDKPVLSAERPITTCSLAERQRGYRITNKPLRRSLCALPRETI